MEFFNYFKTTQTWFWQELCLAFWCASASVQAPIFRVKTADKHPGEEACACRQVQTLENHWQVQKKDGSFKSLSLFGTQVPARAIRVICWTPSSSLRRARPRVVAVVTASVALQLLWAIAIGWLISTNMEIWKNGSNNLCAFWTKSPRASISVCHNKFVLFIPGQDWRLVNEKHFWFTYDAAGLSGLSWKRLKGWCVLRPLLVTIECLVAGIGGYGYSGWYYYWPGSIQQLIDG